MDITKMLLEFSARTGISGAEGDALAYGEELLRPYGEVRRTSLGSLLCTVREPKEGQPHLLLDAHIDEIGMIVTYIEDSGFLRVAACGGIDRRLLMASVVTVHAAAGALTGLVCSVPPHLASDEDKRNKKVDEVYIDLGLDGGRAKELVCLGDRVSINSREGQLLNGYVTGKALDDRAGCVSLLCAAEYLKGEDLDCGLTIAFATQEEVGGQGAKTAAYIANPTHGIAVDVSFAHAPDAPKHKTGEMEGGPMIGFTPILSREMSEKLVELAKAEGIPYQIEAGGGVTHTDADQIATTRCGVAAGLVSIPQKYMHTPIETVSVKDVDNVGKLLAAYARYLGGKR